MSVARGFGLNGKSFYTNVCKPCDVNLNFIVDHSNGNGLGVRSVKSNGYVEAVFMNTSATPGKSAGGNLNPNPAAGYAMVVFKNNFIYYLGGFSGQITPLVSTSTTSTTAGGAYVITSLGTATLAQWQAAGVPQGFVPAVGLGFIAIATGAIGGSATVGLPGEQVAPIVSVVGDPNQTLNNSNIATNAGAQILLQFSGPTAAGNTALTPTAPADGSVVGITFKFDASSVTIDGL
jgi:hypothetical protein